MLSYWNHKRNKEAVLITSGATILYNRVGVSEHHKGEMVMHNKIQSNKLQVRSLNNCRKGQNLVRHLLSITGSCNFKRY